MSPLFLSFPSLRADKKALTRNAAGGHGGPDAALTRRCVTGHAASFHVRGT